MEQQSLTPVTKLLEQTFSTYFKKENLIYFTKIAVVNFLVGAAVFIPLIPLLGIKILFSPLSYGFRSGFSSGNLLDLISGGTSVFLMIAFIVAVLVSIVWGVWGAAAVIFASRQVYEGKLLSLKETYFSVKGIVLKLFFLQLLVLPLIIVFGLILLVIPGIIFAVWFSFATTVCVIEKRGVIESLKRSKELVKGYFIEIVLRLIVITIIIGLIQVGASMFSVVGAIVLGVLGPFFTFMYYPLFEDVRRVKS